MTLHHTLARRASLAAFASAGLLFGAGAASAADDGNDGRNALVEHHRAACLLTRPGADVQACVEEALAAREAARNGELQGDSNTRYQSNALLRCRNLPRADRPACEARVHGRGTTSGSVEEGGILRELVIREQPAAQPPADSATPADAGVPVHIDTNEDPLSDSIPADSASPHGPQLPR